MRKDVNYIASSIKGLTHKVNEDNYLIIDHIKYNVFAVFDGVSSALSAKEATQISKRFIKAHYINYLNGSIALNKLMFDLNNYLCNSGLNEPYSTYCLVLYDKEDCTFYYSWLGDSRLYSVTNQFIEQLTSDDSFSKNLITKFLGDASLSFEDFRQIKKKFNTDYLLLCTDGFYKLLEENMMTFFNTFLKKNLSTVKSDINSLIKGKNFDDSTYIFVK